MILQVLCKFTGRADGPFIVGLSKWHGILKQLIRTGFKTDYPKLVALLALGSARRRRRQIAPPWPAGGRKNAPFGFISYTKNVQFGALMARVF